MEMIVISEEGLRLEEIGDVTAYRHSNTYTQFFARDCWESPRHSDIRLQYQITFYFVKQICIKRVLTERFLRDETSEPMLLLSGACAYLAGYYCLRITERVQRQRHIHSLRHKYLKSQKIYSRWTSPQPTLNNLNFVTENIIIFMLRLGQVILKFPVLVLNDFNMIHASRKVDAADRRPALLTWKYRLTNAITLTYWNNTQVHLSYTVGQSRAENYWVTKFKKV